jgi:hypothetical protein
VSHKLPAFIISAAVFVFCLFTLNVILQFLLVVGAASMFEADEIIKDAVATANIAALVLAAVAAKFAYSRVARRAPEDSTQLSL